MIRRGDKVLAAVSGGPDSLALLTALVALREPIGFDLRAVYVNHGLRPAAARREAELVREMGKRWKVPAAVVRGPVRKFSGESPESAARRLRYNRLVSAAKKFRANRIALGHTADDQAETVLMWFLRGAGTAGLSGIPPVRRLSDGNGTKAGSLRIVRPLIDCSRKEVEEFLKGRGIRPLKDKSNRSKRFLRNRIRHELLPLLERRYSPTLRRHLAQMADLLREDRVWMEQEAQKRFSGTASLRNGKIRFDLRRMRAVPSALRRALLRLAVERLQGNCQGFSAEHWIGLERICLSGECRGLDLPHGFRAEIPIPRRSVDSVLILRRKEV